MLKLTKTAIGLLTNQYRSVLRKCLLLNFGVLICFSSQSDATYKLMMAGDGSFYITLNDGIDNHYDLLYGWGDWMAQTNLINTKTTLSEVQNIQSLNYYYTFRENERAEVIDSVSFFQKDFLTLQKVDLQSKNPTHLGAFAKCDEVCHA